MKSNLCIIFIILLLFNFKSSAQFYFIEDNLEQVEVQFLRKKIEVKEGESFFNILKIKNPSNRKLSFETNFSYPADWSFIGDKTRNIILNPSDSILIPYRAAPAISAKGDIGYAFVASLSDMKGNTFKTEYSFVNVPKITDIKFKPKSRVIYFDQTKSNSTIELLFSNNGNTEEFININFNMSQGVTSDGAQEGLFIDELSLNPKTDTVVIFPLKLNKKRNSIGNKFHRIKIQVITKDTTLNSSVWAKELENTYENFIPYNYKMLTVEAVAQNILASNSSNMNYHIYGYILPKGNSVFNYDFQTYGNPSTADELWKYSRIKLKYSNKTIAIELGDINEIMGHNMFGRGGIFEYNTKYNSKFRLAASQSVFADVGRAAVSYEQKIKQNKFEIGGSYEQDSPKQVNSIIGFGKIGITTGKFGSFILSGSLSNATWNISNKNQLSYSSRLNYNYRSKKTFLNFNGLYAPKEYFGNLPGRNEIRAVIMHKLTNKKRLINDFNYFKNDIPIYVGDDILSSGTSSSLKNKLTYNLNITPTIMISTGPIYETKEGSNFYGSPNSYMRTQSTFGYLSVKKRNRFSNSTLTGTLTGGYNWVSDVYIENPNENSRNDDWISAIIAVNYRSKIWGFTGTYYHGAYSLNQQFYTYYRSQTDKNVIFMPYLDIFLLPKYLRFAMRPNFTYSILTKTSRLNINSELTAYPGKEWEIMLTNSYNYTASKDILENEMQKTTFSASYFELRIRKSFNFNQPKYQYHDLKYYFFKDLNGNNVKDEDEPGVKDVLLVIQKDEESISNEIYNTTSNFMTMDLLSDMNGFIRYDNIPNGFYKVEYNHIGKMEGAFTSENSMDKIYVGRDEIFYIPFHENNKIFGKAILNRSKLSNLGKIDPSNIKITAEDSKGKKYSTLTDASGNFIIYVPNVDKYKVRVNNIYYENFELEQNDYQIQLNGYRQFEVNFIFNEKRRKIKFASSYEYGADNNSPGIEIIRRTNLSGTVKDATTLKPIVASVKVVDSQGNEVTSGKSNLRTGIFTLSFVAGNDYTLEANAEEYWFTAENLYSEQIVTFKNLKKDILLKGITVGQFIPMKTLYFEEGSYEIPPSSFPELELLLKVLRKNPSVKIAIHGHADDMEIQGSTQDLALERAKLVAKYLIASGYNRVKYVGHANTKPIADNDTEDGRKLNRRVEIIVTGK